jgi:hypothetical protein
VLITHSLNSLTLLLCNTNSLSSWRKWSVIVAILTQKLQELFRVLSYERSKLWISSADLLQNRLEHLRVLLYNLSELLELRVIS